MKTHLQYLQQSDWSIRWGKLLVMGTLLLWGSVLTGECCNKTRTSILQLILLLFYLHMSFYLSHLRIARGTALWIYVGLQWDSLFGMLLTLCLFNPWVCCVYIGYEMTNFHAAYFVYCAIGHLCMLAFLNSLSWPVLRWWRCVSVR